MVKGTNRQVIVVKSPDPKLFDEAIFLLRENTRDAELDPEEIIRQARQAADGYLRGCATPTRHRTGAALLFLLGAGIASVAWCVGMFVL